MTRAPGLSCTARLAVKFAGGVGPLCIPMFRQVLHMQSSVKSSSCVFAASPHYNKFCSEGIPYKHRFAGVPYPAVFRTFVSRRILGLVSLTLPCQEPLKQTHVLVSQPTKGHPLSAASACSQLRVEISPNTLLRMAPAACPSGAETLLTRGCLSPARRGNGYPNYC